MATCHVCRILRQSSVQEELHEGFTSLEFHENGLTVTITGIPALVCECGEAVFKSSVAEYISDLVDEALAFERARREKAAPWIPMREIALGLAG
ncbi:MAG: YgiT-type zinc finger protein [Anaerolineae bacterium]|nr:YgiT-type zinc finger protein [Anaerolineae bacterium]